MTMFSEIPDRDGSSGSVDYPWWNSLRAAGLTLERWFGYGFFSETKQTLSNNAAATNVTGLTVDSADYRSLSVIYNIYRKTDTVGSEVHARGEFELLWSAELAAWQLIGETAAFWTNGAAEDAGVTFSVETTSGVGQVKVATSDIAGANGIHRLSFKATSFELS
jgi:hypothetical protein